MSKQTNSKTVSWEMKWVMGKYLTKPYQSFGLDVGLLTGYNAAHWSRNVPLTSYSSSYTAKPQTTTIIIMPAQQNAYHSITSSGSFIMRASLHNRDRFSSARDDLSCPYPSYEDVYLRLNTSNPGSDEFQDLGLSDFLVAQRWVARRKLERLQLTPYQGSLLSQGVQPQWEQREPYNMVLEASLGYAASCSVVVMDEVVDLNERVDVEMREVEEDVRELKGMVVELREELREVREAHGRLSRQVLNTLAEDMRRQLRLPRTPEERAVATIEADLRVADHRRQLDEEEVTDSEWERHALHLAERRAVRRALTLVGFQGRLVPIGELDRAESPPREVIDLTDDSEDDVLDLSSEEEQQAREEEHMGVLTFHAEVERARADPAPEYEAPPPGYNAPGPSRS